METFFIRAIQLILSLSILVLLHEFGHFFFARLFKVRVEKFYMFFNPTFSLIRAKKINGKWDVKYFAKNVPSNERPKLDADGDPVVDDKNRQVMEPVPLNLLADDDWRKHPESTEWGIGWLPLGGYCSISGMVDETKGIGQLASEPQPWEYRSRSVWQRLPIITGGVLVNFLLAMVIFAGVLFVWGEEYIPLKNAKYGLQFSKTMLSAGFQNGDKIISIDGKIPDSEGDISEMIVIDKAKAAVVERNGQQQKINLPADLSLKAIAANESFTATVRFPFVVEEVSSGTPAAKNNLQPGDSIVGINNKPLFGFQEVSDQLFANKSKTIQLDYYRKGALQHQSIALDEAGKLGVAVKTRFADIPTTVIRYGFLESIPAGIGKGWDSLAKYVKGLKFVFTKEGAQQLGGFGGIGKMFPKVWDWQMFWTMTALLSVILAFMNILPIPALDGGYVVYLIYEMITGRKPSDKFLEYAQTIGMLLLLALLLYANGNDIYKALFK